MAVNQIDPSRAVQAALFHGRLMRDTPYSAGPLPEDLLESLAAAAARTIDPAPILEADTDPATRAMAIRLSFAALWAAGFKAGAQAAGPTD